jgi:hypothetical protein
MNYRFVVGQHVAEKLSGRSGRVVRPDYTVEAEITFIFYSVKWDDNGTTSIISDEDLVAAPIPS